MISHWLFLGKTEVPKQMFVSWGEEESASCRVFPRLTASDGILNQFYVVKLLLYLTNVIPSVHLYESWSDRL